MTTNGEEGATAPVFKVYWVHLKSHDDMLSEGYIGVTKHPISIRLSQHKSNARNKKYESKFYNAIRKYGEGNLSISTVFEDADEDWAYSVEEILRPESNIGWNTLAGGQYNTGGEAMSYKIKCLWKDPTSGYNSPEFTTRRKESMSNAWKNKSGKMGSEDHLRKLSEKSKAAWSDSETRKRILNSRSTASKWENGSANKDKWALADYFWCLWKGHSQYASKVERDLGLRKGSLDKMFKNFSNGWNPFEDHDWKSFKMNYQSKGE